MRLKLFLLLLLPWHFAFAQVTYLPFELERYDKSIYIDAINALSTSFTSEQNALEYYFLAYKVQRTAEPANYFPSPDDKRDLAGAYLHENFENGDAIAFINFLETNGSEASCLALLKNESDIKILLPYKFLSSYILNNPEKQREYLYQMKSKGMISNVLASFGENAINSIGGSQIALTQGLQDLIAIEYALSQTSLRVKTLNIFAENCKGYNGIESSAAMVINENQIWISPVVSSTLIMQNQDNMLLSGIGFIIPLENSTNTEVLTGTIQNVGRNFVGINQLAKTPADSGLIGSYLYFARAYKMFASTNGNDIDETQSMKIYKYIEKAIK